MKRSLFLSSLVLAMAGVARGQGVAYTNDIIVVCPPDPVPQIDAAWFVNNSLFEVIFTNSSLGSQLFSTVDTSHFINTVNATLSVVPGLDFQTYPSATGQPHPAAEVINNGLIQIGTATNIYSVTTNGVVNLSNPIGLFRATNIISPGAITVGFDGVCSLVGNNIDLSRGSIVMTNSGFSVVNLGNGSFGYVNNGNNVTISDGFWGYGNVGFNPANQLGGTTPMSAPFVATNRQGFAINDQLSLPNALSYEGGWQLGSNIWLHVAYVRCTNSTFIPNVYINSPTDPSYPNGVVVEWSQSITNSRGIATSSYLDVVDTLANGVPPGITLDGFAGTGGNRPTYIPTSYSVFQSPISSGIGANLVGVSAITAGWLPQQFTTNLWTAYEAIIAPTSIILSDVAGQDVTNLPGRIELTASGALNLELATITAQNFIALNATNQFLGSAGAQISAPYSDLNLRSTNGWLRITNLLRGTVVQPSGYVDLWSSVQTNVINGYTVMFHQLLVDAHLSPIVNSLVEDATLRVTNTLGGDDNLVINDSLDITRSFLFDASRITIASNAPGSPTPYGSLTLENGEVLWPSVTPRLAYLTNNGAITSYSAVFFGGDRSSPYYTSAYQEPYQAFVNTGSIYNNGMFIWARDFISSGNLTAWGGDVQLDEARNAILTNGMVLATNGTISLKGNYILASSNLFVSASLNLAATNTLSDGVTNLASISPTIPAVWPTNGNTWLVGSGGINVPVAPLAGDLIGTTITNTAPANRVVPIIWPGQDRGNSISGFNNNCSLGRLVLVGDTKSVFNFSAPPGQASGALYVDCLQFEGATATNLDQANNYQGVQVASNMKVYFGQALANGVSIAEKLNGRNLNGTGGFYWVSNYNNGYFSSVTMPYPDGYTYRMNAALAASEDIDSSGSGTVNGQNLAPIPPAVIAANQVTNTQPLLAAIAIPPADQVISLGGSALFSVSAGPGLVSYQWLHNLVPIPGATGASYGISPAQWGDRGTFNVLIGNAYGTVLSPDAHLTIQSAPVITLPPTGQSVLTNQSVTFQVAAQGTLPINYQWYFNGSLIPGATGTSYSVARARTSDTGLYSVSAANVFGVTNFQTSLHVLIVAPPTNPYVAAPGSLLASAVPITSGFSAAAGTYSGLISDTNGVAAASSGYVLATVTKSGSYSAKVTLAGKTYTFSGSLNTATPFLKRGYGLAPIALFLQASPTTGGGLLFGELIATNWAAQAVALRSTFTSASPATAYQGTYTMVIPPDPGSANGPSGYGYGTLSVSASGAVHFSGALADGTKFSQTAGVSSTGYWPLFASLYQGHGCAVGWMQYHTGAIVPSSANGLHWVKPAGAPGAINYTMGFTNASQIQGGRFVYQRSSPVLGGAFGQAFDLSFTGGGVTIPAQMISLGTNNRFSRTSGVSFSLNTGSGLFTGRTTSAEGISISFQGVLLQSAASGFGYYLGTTANQNSGVVEFQSAP